MKTCTVCSTLKPLEAFNRTSRMKDGRQSECRICKNTKARTFFSQNRDLCNARSRAWADTNPETVKEYTKRHAHTSASRSAKSRRDNPMKASEYSRRWRGSNKGKVNASTRARQARKLNATPGWLTPNDYNKMQMLYTIAVWVSDRTGVPMQVDHEIPLRGKTVSGFHCPDNLQVIRTKDNQSKGNSFKSGVQ